MVVSEDPRRSSVIENLKPVHFLHCTAVTQLTDYITDVVPDKVLSECIKLYIFKSGPHPIASSHLYNDLSLQECVVVLHVCGIV